MRVSRGFNDESVDNAARRGDRRLTAATTAREAAIALDVNDPLKPLEHAWRWLPVFQMVAEAESITRAAERLRLSPTAISRAIRIVEESLGCQVFDRVGRSLVLNPNGAMLLEEVQKATATMCRVIDAVSAKETSGFGRIATVGQLDRVFILPALLKLRREAPKLRFSVVHLEPEGAIDALESGAIDLFVALNFVCGGSLIPEVVAEVSLGVYAGCEHPLFEQKTVTVEDIAAQEFVAQRRPSLVKAIWPSGMNRHVTLTVDSHALALDACLSGGYLMMMEDVTAHEHVAAGRLRRLPVEEIPPAELVVVRHERTQGDPRTKMILDMLVTTSRELIAASA